MGVFLTLLVFGFPILFLFWACCSLTVGGSFVGGFMLMIILIVIPIAIDLKKTESDPKWLKQVEKRNNEFQEKIKNAYGKCFSIDDGEGFLLFEAFQYNGFCGRVTEHSLKDGFGRSLDFKDIRSCILSNRKKTIKSCSVNEPSILNQNTESEGFKLTIKTHDNFLEFKSDNFEKISEMYDITEYIITKGRSMETSPFSK